MSAIATYPGTVTPLRGLGAFAESERDVFFGRDREREELARLIIGEGFRAGLLYGEPGVGKTSLLRAGLIPHLRDHGVVVLVCEDIDNPIESFAQAVIAATGLEPAEGERAIAFLARVVGQALAGQLYLFILDQVDDVFRHSDDRVIGGLGDLFARVVSRSGGRARFLFSCASERVHRFGALERRTGSLFPPSSRYELTRMSAAEAAEVLERTLAFAGAMPDPTLARSLAEDMGQVAPILPADLQIAALAVRELGIGSAHELQGIGGASELPRAWLSATCRATGNERSAMRLVAELAAGSDQPYAPEWAAARASIEPTFAAHALSVLSEKGVVRPVEVIGTETPHYALAHEILAPRVREVAAPARAAARRAFELLGSKASQKKRLSVREWLALRRERIEPATPAERAVIDRTRRTAFAVAGAVAAAPVVALLAIYVAMAGNYYLDVGPAPGGERIVVRAGSPGLSDFDWMPHSPGFGSVVADTGITRAMVAPGAWERIEANEVGADLDEDDLADTAVATLRPGLRSLIAYAADGSESALESLRQGAEGPADLVELLEHLRPVARGGPREVAVVEQALMDASPAVQSAALAVAVSAAERREGAYQDLLSKALASSDRERRRLAFSAARALGDDTAMTLFQRALASGPEAEARRELLAIVTGGGSGSSPSAGSATSVLANGDISEETRARARELLERSFTTSPARASEAAAELAGDPEAPGEDRARALELLNELAPEESYEAIGEDVRAAMRAKAQPIRAAALPVFARLAPKEAAGDLALMLENSSLDDDMREAMALAWGEVAKSDKDAAQVALEKLLEDRSFDVRAAAARAYGNLGRRAQSDLVDLVDDAPFKVKVGAAYGLANSAVQGGSKRRARGGIYQLWREKGSRKRIAAQVYARMARDIPASVIKYSYYAARDRRDDRLHAIGVEGLCNGVAAGSKQARRYLARVADDVEGSVRRKLAECATDHAKHTWMASTVAETVSGDPDADIRAEAARILAKVARNHEGEIRDDVGETLARLTGDDNRGVRLIALGGIASLGARAPKEAAEALADSFEGADQAEKLAILDAAAAVGAGELARLGIADESPRVRKKSIATAIATGTDAGSAMSSALTDPDEEVRLAALRRLASGEHGLGPGEVTKALALAARDPAPEIRTLALTTFARVADTERVAARLDRMLSSRSERERVRAAVASRGLAERDPARARQVLEPVLDDPSHDVRVALLSSLAPALAAELSAEDLAGIASSSETHAPRRLVATAALLVLARDEGTRPAAVAALETIQDGPPLARMAARLGAGLLAAEADGVEFLALLVP